MNVGKPLDFNDAATVPQSPSTLRRMLIWELWARYPSYAFATALTGALAGILTMKANEIREYGSPWWMDDSAYRDLADKEDEPGEGVPR